MLQFLGNTRLHKWKWNRIPRLKRWQVFLIYFIIKDIAASVDLLEKAVFTLETRFSTRALRLLGNIRPHLSVSILVTAIQNHLKNAKNVTAEQLFAYLNHKGSLVEACTKPCLPEVELFMGLLVILFLHDSKEFMKGREVANILVGQIQSLNRRQSDLIAARIYFYFSRFFEVTNDYLSVRG
jgi:26S proteasome regulatory subunit N3